MILVWRGSANRRWGQTVTLQPGRSLGASCSSCGTDVFQCASAAAFFFFSPPKAVIFVLKQRPHERLRSDLHALLLPSVYIKTLTLVSLSIALLCSSNTSAQIAGFALITHPSHAKSFPGTHHLPPLVHFPQPKHTLHVFSRESTFLSDKAQVIQPLM